MILEELAGYAKKRVEKAKEKRSLEQIRKEAYEMPVGDFRFERALQKDKMSLICEIKKASPSRGIISQDFPYLKIAKEYERAGADSISVLTEPKWFLGSDQIFKEVRERCSLPLIRKDFTVDVYQIYEAKILGADAVLLICSLLNTETLREYLAICHELGIAALVETHNEEEISSAIKTGAKIIGVNNRNLKDFSVDFENAKRLKEKVPKEMIFVAESGVQCAEDVAELKKIGVNAALIGEALMRTEDIRAALTEFRKAAGI
ncbi:MAG: indole-3-glycerol phosphate synthase TrpC [Lachnospiraceae bacterium]|nr:indole-3-glycerol phosphate synthase TrpC [Lachnospiraceae bacterium]